MTCLDLIKPRLFDCFSEMIAAIPARSVVWALARESYMLGVDLVRTSVAHLDAMLIS